MIYLRPSVAAMLLTLLAQPGNLLAHSDTGSVKPGGRFTPNEVGAEFPPQPRLMNRIEQHVPVDGASGSTGELTSRSNSAADKLREATALAEVPQVAAALGASYVFVSSAPLIEKWSDSAASRIRSVYFSHSNRQTVKVTSENGRVLNVEAVRASVEQPPLSEQEMRTAIEVATRYWARKQHPDIHQLVGYAIQTFQADGSPYDSRVVYVSFHTASPELPLLLTWVDLGLGQVVRAETAR